MNPKFFEYPKVTYTDEYGVTFSEEQTLLMRLPRQMKEYTVPDGVMEIYDRAATGREELESITMPGSVKGIGQYAFKDCWNLRHISLSENIQHIGMEAFRHCKRLSTIIIPNGDIGRGAFQDCPNLTDVILREGVTHIGEKAFSGCSRLSCLYLPGSIKEISPNAFEGTAIKDIHVPAAHKQRFEQMGICNRSNDIPTIILLEYEDIMEKTPNLFDYATSELSQDAFISWLLMWGNEKYRNVDAALHSIACKMINEMIREKEDVEEQIEVRKVTIKQQEAHIDVLAIVNDTNDKQYAFIIEDKTDTSEHSKQLMRYTNYVREAYPNATVTCVYFKSGNECKTSIQKMIDKYNDNKHDIPLQLFTRNQILDILRSEASNNMIVQNYIDYLSRIEKLTNSFYSTPVTEWGSRAWEGFCMEIDNKLAELCPKWDHQKYNGGIELALKSIAIRNTNVKFFLQIKGDKKDEKLQGTRVLFCIKGLKSIAKDWKMPKEWETAITIFKTGMEGPKIIPLKYYKDNDKKTFAYIKGKDFFGTEQVDVAEIVYKLVDWHKKLQALADKLSEAEATQSDK